MILVDSSVWIAYFRQIESPAVLWLRNVENATDIVVADLVMFEVLRGAYSAKHAAELHRQLRLFTGAVVMSSARAVAAARNYRLLRSEGITPRSMADLLIATYCLDRGYRLLHQDRDFDAFEAHLGLDVIHP